MWRASSTCWVARKVASSSVPCAPTSPENLVVMRSSATIKEESANSSSSCRALESLASSASEPSMSTVLFLCLQNAGRSQISQALFEQFGAGRHGALSAGTSPAERVHPEVIDVMRELGAELADRQPQLLTHELA